MESQDGLGREKAGEDSTSECTDIIFFSGPSRLFQLSSRAPRTQGIAWNLTIQAKTLGIVSGGGAAWKQTTLSGARMSEMRGLGREADVDSTRILSPVGFHKCQSSYRVVYSILYGVDVGTRS